MAAEIYKGTVYRLRKTRVCIRAQLYRLRKNSSNEGHGFSRATLGNDR